MVSFLALDDFAALSKDLDLGQLLLVSNSKDGASVYSTGQGISKFSVTW
jgi:hypothetical protein